MAAAAQLLDGRGLRARMAWPGLAWPGLAITPPNAFAGTPDGPAAIRIPLGGGSDRRQLALGLARLSAPLAARPQDAAAVI